MHRIEQEGADACSKHPKVTVSNRRFCLGTSPVHLLQIPYPHKTAGPCADCILPCTCRPWWSGRWGGTAGSSLHCCCCRDWCLGTQKHRQNKNPRGWNSCGQSQTGSAWQPKTGRCTFLHSFIVDLHVHHGGRAVPQDLPVAAILLVAGPYLVGSLVSPPQLVP